MTEEKKDILKGVKSEGEKKKTVDPRDLDAQLGPLNKVVEEDKAKTGGKFYHRLISTKRLDMRKYQGYEVVEGQDKAFGGLIVARMPKELRKERLVAKEEKIKRRTRGLKEAFHEQGRRLGVETFEEDE